MNAELKKKWVDALRSGKYVQQNGHMHNILTNKYCALGVLCEVAGVQKREVHEGKACYSYQYDVGVCYPPKDFIDDFCIPASLLFDIVVWNDSLNFPFSEIANLIEQYNDRYIQ